MYVQKSCGHGGSLFGGSFAGFSKGSRAGGLGGYFHLPNRADSIPVSIFGHYRVSNQKRGSFCHRSAHRRTVRAAVRSAACRCASHSYGHGRRLSHRLPRGRSPVRKRRTDRPAGRTAGAVLRQWRSGVHLHSGRAWFPRQRTQRTAFVGCSPLCWPFGWNSGWPAPPPGTVPTPSTGKMARPRQGAAGGRARCGRFYAIDVLFRYFIQYFPVYTENVPKRPRIGGAGWCK